MLPSTCDSYSMDPTPFSRSQLPQTFAAISLETPREPWFWNRLYAAKREEYAEAEYDQELDNSKSRSQSRIHSQWGSGC